jgi:adenine phosphoribosyltransferase
MFEEHFRYAGVQAIVGMESRGFIFGAALAARMHVAFVPARKPGRLPADVESISYALEYGTDTLEIHKDAISQGEKVLIVDDLIATGGTAKATGELVQKLGGEVVGFGFLIDLTFLKGTDKLAPHRVVSLLHY